MGIFWNIKYTMAFPLEVESEGDGAMRGSHVDIRNNKNPNDKKVTKHDWWVSIAMKTLENPQVYNTTKNGRRNLTTNYCGKKKKKKKIYFDDSLECAGGFHFHLIIPPSWKFLFKYPFKTTSKSHKFLFICLCWFPRKWSSFIFLLAFSFSLPSWSCP